MNVGCGAYACLPEALHGLGAFQIKLTHLIKRIDVCMQYNRVIRLLRTPSYTDCIPFFSLILSYADDVSREVRGLHSVLITKFFQNSFVIDNLCTKIRHHGETVRQS